MSMKEIIIMLILAAVLGFLITRMNGAYPPASIQERNYEAAQQGHD